MNDISSTFPVLPREQEAIRAKCFHPAGTYVAFRAEEIEQSIPERFEKIAAIYPDRLAVKTKERTLTYDELNRAANGVARAVLAQRSESGEPIALLFEHGAAAIAAMLGVLKAGMICVPLDPGHPPERVTSLLKDSQASLVLTNSRNLLLAKELTKSLCGCLNVDELDAGSSINNLGVPLSANAFAIIYYTSGSTGKPKGIVHSHRSILYNIQTYTNDIHICSSDRLTQLQSFSFFASVLNLFGALLNGAGLCLFDPKEHEPTQLMNWLNDEEITILHTVPTLFRNLTDTLSGAERFPNLRLIQLASDSVTLLDVEQYKKHFSSNCIFANRLGITETGTIRRFFIDKNTPLKGNAVPVGYAVEGNDSFLLSDDGNDVGFNCVGEIAVRSRYLSTGYWRRPDLTESSFRRDPNGGDKRLYFTGDLGTMSEDGCLEYLGRRDFQVKIRGYRVEIAQIETALLGVGTIKDVVVIAKGTESGDKRLVAYVVAAGEPSPSVNELRRLLNAKLPDYMVPSTIIFLQSLPLTPNGKVDRLVLPDPGKSRPALETPFVEPGNSIEEELAKAWSEVLDLDRVGIQDDFFSLGGDSLTAGRITSKVMQAFGVELPIKTIFEHPTIAGLAVLIAEDQAKQASDQVLDLILEELEAMSMDEIKRTLASATLNGDRTNGE
jgi:amino acid adenylation domain-containing protein